MADKQFVAYDGESYTVESEHRYVMLCNSNKQSVVDPTGLSSKACFDFLLETHYADHVAVMFGMNYDVNMMLRDFGQSKLKQLWATGKCSWFNYRLEWIPSKWFVVKDERTGRRVKVCEAFGFFQQKFTAALDAWKIAPQDRDELETMKASRSVFDPTMTNRMLEYCFSECMDLVRLMNALRDALDEAGIKVQGWYGAGCVAAAVMRKQRVKAYHSAHTALDPNIQYAMMCAYFGGRTELFKQGSFPRLYQYDINSAYPFAAMSLPSLQGGRWYHGPQYFNKDNQHGVVLVKWADNGSAVGPFPYRYKGSRICYPVNGMGWYHAVEVELARAYGANVEVLDAFIYKPDSIVRPFAFVDDYYNWRAELKSQGNAAEKVIKLGLNSIYGKLAQGVGYGDKPPAFQSYFWAGEITARTRATMHKLAATMPTNVVMIATDGIFTDYPLDILPGSGLGNLDAKQLDRAFTAQPGVYEAWHEGKRIARSRGFEAKDIDFEVLREGYAEHGSNYIGHYFSTRFIGLGAALMLREMDSWRTWVTAERRLSLYPSVKRPTQTPLGGLTLHLPPVLPDPVIGSQPYRAKLAGHLDNELDYVQSMEQPLR